MKNLTTHRMPAFAFLLLNLYFIFLKRSPCFCFGHISSSSLFRAALQSVLKTVNGELPAERRALTYPVVTCVYLHHVASLAVAISWR